MIKRGTVCFIYFVMFFPSFIRLCDYLVVTMLHRLSIYSVETVLKTFQRRISNSVQIKDLVQPIPESIEEQEKILQVY